MSLPQKRTFTKGDRLRSLVAVLEDPDTGEAIDLTGQTVALLMVPLRGATKINYAACTVVQTSPTVDRGKVRYDWTAGDVDTAGVYFAWFRRTSGGLTEHFPGDGKRLFEVEFVEAS